MAIGSICERILLPALEKFLGQDVDKFVATNFPISVACLRITNFYKAGGKIIRKEAETLFLFCQTRFAL
ncbi:MAG: hypothetical protein A2908_00135 [Candidatus Staskawiczbacteria bacterium RIFCSPLOWO2_01_FULL_38_12b]|uniref:Uncharacterized protein n=1 Tax=Candidatus Staskawiczbacteria bacterium RIFCSPLOWO2_01_FULL_38_12b TaxID=1802214 RepID=A0A1G2IE20_9BACT|nr:MAG: hypothetical protein A2908_00135 [Candidatus Staskawiczbacteria bacterium RIFCSPLOWO2_01_FULL_38_12b]